MPLFITSVTALVLVLIYSVLSLRIIYMRRTGVGPSVGLGENEQFVRAVRAHGNMAEYAPLFLVLLLIGELQSGSVLVLTNISLLFILGRIIHAVGFGYIGKGPWRTIGMVGTITALMLMALYNVFRSL